MSATARGERRMKEDARKRADDASLDVVERLRAQCLLKGARGIKGLGRVFRIMDDNGNKKLDYAEFKKGLKDFGVFLDSEQEYRAAFDRFDLNHDGNLDFEEFLKVIRPPMSSARQRVIKQAFAKLDKNGDGTLQVSELKRYYNVKHHPKYVNGQWSEEQVFQEFVKSIGDDGDGLLTYEEFFNYYSGVSASIDDDAYFDLMMRQAWKL